MARKSYPHVTAAKKYARLVFNGKKVAGHYERQAAERFLTDLERNDIEFRPHEAERACKFIEKFRHVKGRWARDAQNISLEPWQSFVLCNIFGFYIDGLRRFTEAYIRVARKNGKSILAAGIGLYMFTEDDEWGAEIYSGATSEKQAWEVFRPARLMALQHPDFQRLYGIDIGAKNMSIVADDSRFEPIIGNPGDGSSPHCALIDEYHEHNTPAMYQTMTSGMGAREQPLCLIITTAGTNIASPCFEKDDEIKKMLDGVYKDDSIFGLIYEPDKEDADNWQSITAMKKANPNLDVSVAKRFLLRELAKAERSPSEQASYKTKNLNIWVGSGQTFLNPLVWKNCGNPKITIQQCIDEDWSCFFGLDLASRIDFVALMRVFVKRVDDNLHYRWFPKFWLPENRIEEDNTGQYLRWADKGLVQLHDDDEIDFAKLRADIITEAEYLNPREIAYDPWRAIGLEQELSNHGLRMVKIGQTVSQFADPMNELQAAHLSGRIQHDGNEILNWMAGNLVCKEDTNGNKKPRREIAKNKIDGMVAGLMAVNRALATDITGGFVTGTLKTL